MTDENGTLAHGSVQAVLRSHARLKPESTDPAKHAVEIYTSEQQLAVRIAAYVSAGLEAGDAILIVARPAHWMAIGEIFAARGIDLDALRHSGSVRYLNAQETLDALMRDGVPDAMLFERVVGEEVVSCLKTTPPHKRLRAYGEMVDILWLSGFQTAALQLEELWNRLQQRHDFALLCAYSAEGFVGDLASIDDVVAAHTHITVGSGDLKDGSSGANGKERPAAGASPRSVLEGTARRQERETTPQTPIGLDAQEALRDELPLRLVADALPVLVAVVDTKERYRFVNAAFERWIGRPQGELVGRHVADVLGRPAYEELRPRIEAALGGTSVEFDAALPLSSRGARVVEVAHVPMRSPRGDVTGFVAITSDVTERRVLERMRAAESARADRLLHITTAIADAISTEEVFSALVDSVADAIGASSSGLWLLDEPARTARLARSRGYTPMVAAQLAELPLDAEPGVPVVDSMRRNAPVWIDSKRDLLTAYPHLDAVATKDRRYRVACLPLNSQGRVLGALGLTIESEGTLNEEERGFLLVVARYASQALERIRLLEAERSSRGAAQAAAQRSQVMARISRVFVEADLALPARLRVVASEFSAALGGYINIWLLEPDQMLHLAAVHHPIPAAQAQLQDLTASHPIALGEGVTGTIAQSNRSVLLQELTPGDILANAPAAYEPFLQQFPPSALIGVPLTVRGRTIGTVTATRVHKSQTYTGDELSLMEELADRAAVAIENSRLFQETVDARSRADLLYAFAQAVSASASLEEVYEAALGTIEAALGTRRLAILTSDHDGKPRFRAWHFLSDAYRRAVDGHSPWAVDATHFAPVLVADALRDPALASYAELFEREHIGALGFFPLVMRGKLLGKFMVYYAEPHTFLQPEIDLASSIANHLASVISRFTAIKNLEETLKANELFAAVLAHDLRNPLGAIVNSAQLLLMRQEAQVDSTGMLDNRPISRILRSGARMTAMIDQLLDFTRARSGGGISVAPHPCDLSELAAQAGSELELAHPDWRIRCETQGDGNGRWEAARILQVISNLVANAGEHGTNPAAITVDVDGSSSSEVLLKVRNAGVIPEAVRATMFEPFLGSRRTQGSGTGGLGLGLFIVREIVRAHGGTVLVECTDTDTVASVRLPRDPGNSR